MSTRDHQRVRDSLELVDTALLKCYMRTKSSLATSLLRLRDNACNLDESERVLRRSDAPYELFLLYARNQQHRQALELLHAHANKLPGSYDTGLGHTIDYLQTLGGEHLPLVLEFAKWILGTSSFMLDC